MIVDRREMAKTKLVLSLNFRLTAPTSDNVCSVFRLVMKLLETNKMRAGQGSREFPAHPFICCIKLLQKGDPVTSSCTELQPRDVDAMNPTTH